MNSIKKSLFYSLAESYLGILIQIASSMVLARLLTPTEIGKFSIGVAALAIAHVIRDFGVGTYIVQAKELTKQDMKAVFGIALLIAWSFAVSLYLSRNSIADFYHEPALAEIMAWMSLNFVIIPFSSTVFPLLVREMKFHLLFYISLINTVLSSAATIYLAYQGYSYMSLVWGSLAHVVVGGILATCFRPKHSFVIPSLKGSKHILTFGSKVSLTNILGKIGGNAAELVIGKSLGFASIALFGKAQTIIDMFSQQLLGAISKVYFPVIAQQHHDNKPLNIAFSDATTYITAFAFPFYGFLALYAEEIILIMFGNQWLVSAGLIKILALGGCLHAIWSFAPSTLNALGKPGDLLRAQLIIQCFRVSVIIPAALVSLDLIAWAQVAAFAMGLLVYLHLLVRLIALNVWRFLLRLLMANLLLTVLSLVIPFSIKYYPYTETIRAAWLLVLAVVAFALSWMISLFLTKNPLAYQITNSITRKNKAVTENE